MPLLTSLSGKVLSTSTRGVNDEAFVAPTITPSYAPANGQSLNEGQEIAVTFATTGVADNQLIDYTITGVSAADYSTTASNQLTVTGNTASASFILNEDLTTEGSETFTLAYTYDYEHPVDGTTTISGTASWTVVDSSETPVDPTYILGTNKASVNENSSVTITLTTANVSAATTVDYTISGVTSADINGASLTGSFVTGTTDSIVIIAAADATTEGTENITLALDNGEDSITIPINDTSLDPTYALSASSTNANEGDTFTVNLVTTDIANGTEVGYTISGITTADIGGASLTGNFVVQSNAASLSVNITADESLSEGVETFQIVLDNGQGGTVQVVINDTSVDTAPAYLNFTLQTATTVNESGSSTFRITGRNIAQGTTIAYTLSSVSGTISASDFVPASLTRTVTWASAANNVSQTQDFVVTLSNDEITEGAESYKVVLAATDSATTATGSLESATVTVGDTSLTPVIGQKDFLSSASWTVPTDVTSVSIVCVGGGAAGGSINSSYSGGGGAGGSLAYANNVSVTPGETLSVTVGAGGLGQSRNSGTSNSGGLSRVRRGGTTLCQAAGGGGAGATSGGAGQTANIGTVSYAGGSGGTPVSFSRGGGGGGAAGYGGTGGAGSNGNSFNAGGAGSGGGGGGGGASPTTPGQSAGGGVGILGQGTAGAGGNYANDGKGGSGGAEGVNGIGGAYGGGGSGSTYNGNPATGAGTTGGAGAVRIIYPGTSRVYPTTRTTNETSVAGSYDTLVINKTSIEEFSNNNNAYADATVTFTLTTTDVPEGTTVGYTFVNVTGTVNASDFILRDSLFTIGSDGTASISMQAQEDWATEGTESFKIALAATDSVGNDTENLQSPAVSISDDYVATVYNSISLDKATYNEGETITITVDYTGNYDKSIQVLYTISASGTGDFVTTTRRLTLLGGATNEYDGKTVIVSDLTTEGAETLTVTLNAFDLNGNATNSRSTTATIVDTSQTPRIPGTAKVGTINMPSTSTWYGLGSNFGSTTDGGIGGNNDFVIVGGKNNGDGYSNGIINPGCGQAVIFNRATQAVVRTFNSPTLSETYGKLSKFGAGVDIGEYNGYLYACIAAPNYRDSSNVLRPRIYIYITSDGFSSVSLLKTLELTEYTSYAGAANLLMSDRSSFKVQGRHIVISDWNYNSTGLVKYHDLATGYAGTTMSTATTLDDWTGFGIACNDTYIGYTDPTFDGTWAGGSVSTQQEGRFAAITASTGALKRGAYGFQYGGGFSGNPPACNNFYLGSSIALTANRVWFTSVGDDYSGYTNAGRLRNLYYTGGSGATINNPMVTSTSNDELNYNSFKSLDGNGNDYVVMVWDDPYGSGQSIRVYNEAGTLQKTVTPPTGKKYGEYGNVKITEEYLYLPTSDIGGGGANVIDIY